MQISDEMLDRADMAFRLSSADRKGALRAALEYALSAISLPVQPVAWRCNKLNVKDGPTDILVWNRATAEFHRDHHDAEITPLYANPVPPTKGPEDDLRMARRAALQAKKQRMGYHSGALWEEYVSGANDKNDDVQSALLALRSRPASALPVVGEDGAK